MSKLVKLNESALLAAGLPRDFVETMRHLVRQAGAITFDTTLPEVASMTDGLTPIVNGLTITLTATNQNVSILETDTTEQPFIDTSIKRRLDEMQAELERGNIGRATMAREISLLRDDLGMYESGQVETGSSIRFKLGVSTLSGSNTGDQTLASLGAAALAGSSTQAFSTAALTAAGLVTVNSGQIKFPATQNNSADPNTLDDYEEGTWTATFTTSGTQPTTPPTSTSRYTKIGRVVTAHMVIANFTVSGATGNISVAGLPFTAAYPATGAVWSWAMGATPMVARIDTGTTSMQLATQIDNNGIPVTNGAAQYLYATVSYLA